MLTKALPTLLGMSRDKLGAAAVTGFVMAAALKKATKVNIIAEIPFVRNSIGPDSYVSDEVIYARSNIRGKVLKSVYTRGIIQYTPANPNLNDASVDWKYRCRG